MYDKFKDEIVDVGLDHHTLRGTLIETYDNYLVLIIVDPITGIIKEAIINIKKVNYISRCVRKKK